MVFLYLSSVLSILFRLAVYIFLRVIPTGLGKLVLPVLYITYLLSSVILAPRAPDTPLRDKKANKNIRPQYNHVFRILLLSLPTTSRRLRIVNFALNTLLLIAAVDFVITPYLDPAEDVIFTRIGAVYPESIKLVSRYPGTDEKVDLRVLYREYSHATANEWIKGPLLTFEPQHDWVVTSEIHRLWPNTSYEYILSKPNETTFRYPTAPLRFRTFPDPRLSSGNRFGFVVSSCVTPNFPYRGPLHRRSIKGFDLLADYLHPSSLDPPNNKTNELTMDRHAEFLLFLGDFIYADVPLYFGDDKEAYRRLYRRNYNSGSFRKIYERLPIFHAYDDHEFINNFGANGNDSTPPYLNASNAFKLYNSNANFDPVHPGEHYYEFQYGDSAFFVLDTRRYRTTLEVSNRTMLGDTQLASFHEWLSRVNQTSTFKFVVSSVPFTSLWGLDAQADSWAGFPEEKNIILKMLHSVPNVIILSGDRHEFASIKFTGPNPSDHSVWEFSTSPLSMFYIPIVRTLRMQSEDFVQRDRTKTVITENGPETTHYVEAIPRESVIKYIAKGNYKWSTVTVDTTDAQNPILKLDTMIDGQLGSNFEILGTPVELQSSTALSTLVASGIKELIHKFGIEPRKWF